MRTQILIEYPRSLKPQWLEKQLEKFGWERDEDYGIVVMAPEEDEECFHCGHKTRAFDPGDLESGTLIIRGTVNCHPDEVKITNKIKVWPDSPVAPFNPMASPTAMAM